MFHFAGSLQDLLRHYADIPMAEIDALLRTSRTKEYNKGECFVVAGESAQSVGFVQRGLFRAIGTSLDGLSYIRNFCSQGYFIGSYASAIQGLTADMRIEAIEPSVVIAIEYGNLREFFKKSAAWQELGRKIAENHYVERELKEFRLLTLNAKERYECFVAENPHLLGRVTQAEIASYIGVAPESLSRALKAKK